MSPETKEICHEEIFAVSADPFYIMHILFFSTCFIRTAAALGFKPGPVSATPAPEEDTILPDSPPLEPQQPEASAGGEEQVEATNAPPADGTSKYLTSHG
jgi:hypothetical protein